MTYCNHHIFTQNQKPQGYTNWAYKKTDVILFPVILHEDDQRTYGVGNVVGAKG